MKVYLQSPIQVNIKYDILKHFNHRYKNYYFGYNDFDYGYKFLCQIQFTINLTTFNSHMLDSKSKNKILSSFMDTTLLIADAGVFIDCNRDFNYGWEYSNV